MDEICFECRASVSKVEYLLMKTCMKCHHSVCMKCQEKHVRRSSDHTFYLSSYLHPSGSFCREHKGELLRLFCRNCDTIICSSCFRKDHGHHDTQYVSEALGRNICDVLKNETGNLSVELVSIEKDLNTCLDERARIVKQLYAAKFEMEKFRGKVNSALNDRIADIDCYIKCLPYELHNNLDAFLNEFQSVVIRERVNKEILRNAIIVMRTRGNFELIQRYLRYKEDMKYAVKKPDSRRHHFRSVDIRITKPSDGEIKTVLPKVEIGSERKSPEEERDVIETKYHSKLMEKKEETIAKMTKRQHQNEQEISLLKDLQDWMLEYVKTFLITKDHRPTMKTSVARNKIDLAECVVEQFTKYMDKIQKTLDSNTERIKQLRRDPNVSKQNDEKSVKKEQAKGKMDEPSTVTTDSKRMEKQISDLGENLSTVIQQNEYLVKQLEKAEHDREDFRESNDKISTQYSIMKQKLQQTEKELDDVRTRLSQVAGAKLTSGNPGITDLGDKYRPTKIAEMYSSVYDSEWTEAMDELLKSKWTEYQIVRHLFIVLQGCYGACRKIAKEQLEEIYQKFDIGATTEEIDQKLELHVAEIKQLKDIRKGVALKTYPSVQKMIFDERRFEKEILHHKDIDRQLLDGVCKTPFTEKCVLICWLMVIQDPEMYIDEDLKPGSALTRETYREYTQSGTKVAFSVWPALYLKKDGPLLMKGVVQPDR